MTKHYIFKHTVAAVAIAAALSTTTAYADVHASADLLKVQPSAVYHAVHGKSLADTLAQVAQRSGITFKINTDLGKDVVSQSIAADNWNNAVRSLLVNYNFTTIQDGDTIKTVIVTGHNNDAVDAGTAKAAAVDNVIVIEPKPKTLPAKYRGFPAGSVTAVNLPVNTMMNVKDKSTIGLDLPMGQFNVAHDYTVNEEDGSKTWVGYLAEEGQGYRVLLSQGAGGVMGVITTPDGTYNIESDGGGAYLVDTNQLQHAGYEGDSVAPSEAMMGAIANATQSQVDQLQAALNAAKVALDAANALVTKDTVLLNAYQTQQKAAQSNLTTATAKRDAAQNTYNVALAAYRAKPVSANLAAVNAASIALMTAKNVYAYALYLYQSATNNVNSINSSLSAAKAAAAKAQANYNQTLTALNAAKAAPATPATASGAGGAATSTPAAASTPVVDLMVVYTTVGQTAAYAKQRITLLTTASNQAYVDSGINMKLRLVYTEPTTYVENNSNSQALVDLANDRGAFAGISQKRVQYGADLVFLFRPLYAQTAGSCGTTYVEFATGSPANKWLGYGTIGDGNAKDTAGYYCAINTFTHEIGHSLGLVHDREYSNFTGVFNYSYAWGVQGTFATIMSYKQPVLMYFSTPALSAQCKGQPCGYPETDAARSSDQAKSVNYTAPIVSNFMTATVAAPILN